MEQHDLSTECLRLSRQPQPYFSRFKKLDKDISRRLSPKVHIDSSISTTTQLKEKLHQLMVRYNRMKDERKERQQMLMDRVEKLTQQLENSARKCSSMAEQSRELKSQVEQSKYDLSGIKKILEIQKGQNQMLRKKLEESERLTLQFKNLVEIKDNEIRRLQDTAFNHGPYIDKHLKSQYEITKVLLIEKQAKCKDLERYCNKLKDQLQELRMSKEVDKVKRLPDRRATKPRIRHDQTLNRSKSVSYCPCHIKLN